MTVTRRLAVVSGGLSQPSSTRMLADRLTNATVEELRARGTEVDLTSVELRDHARDLTSMMLTGFASPALEATIDAVTGADGLIAVSPVFSASYSGLFKSFFDVIDPASLERMPVLLGATAGTQRHSLVIEHAMRPLFAYLRAEPVATGVFAATDDWGSGAGGELAARIERAARQLADRMEAKGRTGLNADPWGFGAAASVLDDVQRS
ncbi:NADPH-dependent FMN reductase [Salinibacterium sp. dk2585]|uniref:FMN reductase n=1 Tax=unclassified Salinibacterium TaxID=2632331 RepID=UPI0011C24BEB|nr:MULTISPECIES: FMN reductase [unclassified Salinibacterium]QEE61679.1 NADPH-dependent FMN reductase [Salinibacterium sp. dk2585]TXK54769.1 NADPH-dependent FMN reductase [Salinibacterium sp. dk5596]